MKANKKKRSKKNTQFFWDSKYGAVFRLGLPPVISIYPMPAPLLRSNYNFKVYGMCVFFPSPSPYPSSSGLRTMAALSHRDDEDGAPAPHLWRAPTITRPHFSCNSKPLLGPYTPSHPTNHPHRHGIPHIPPFHFLIVSQIESNHPLNVFLSSRPVFQLYITSATAEKNPLGHSLP